MAASEKPKGKSKVGGSNLKVPARVQDGANLKVPPKPTNKTAK